MQQVKQEGSGGEDTTTRHKLFQHGINSKEASSAVFRHTFLSGTAASLDINEWFNEQQSSYPV